MKVVDFAGIKVDNLTMAEAVARAEDFLNHSKPHLIVTPNPEIIVSSQEDQELKEIINSADLRLPDGISMVVVSRMIGTPLRERVTGIDLMLRIVEKCSQNNTRIFLLGGEPGIAEEAGQKLVQRYPGLNIVGTQDGFFEQEGEVIEEIKESKPDILFVGLGAGKQEKWLKKHLNNLNIKVGMVIGGSFDVISGKKKRAPKWVQKLYIEWLYRLITEPNRWKRQLALPKFLWIMFSLRNPLPG